jgi:roadblock/LC7 domain-containing protein
MLKRLLVLDGVVAVCRFQDDGTIVESVGMIPQEMMDKLGRFALWYRRMISSNTDVFSLFSQMNGWAPSRGWVVRGEKMSVCSVTNLVAMVENQSASLNEIMRALEDASHE